MSKRKLNLELPKPKKTNNNTIIPTRLTDIIIIKDILFVTMEYLNVVELFKLSICNRELYQYIEVTQLIWQIFYLRDVIKIPRGIDPSGLVGDFNNELLLEGHKTVQSIDKKKRKLLTRKLYLANVNVHKCQYCKNLAPYFKSQSVIKCDKCRKEVCPDCCIHPSKIFCGNCKKNNMESVLEYSGFGKKQLHFCLGCMDAYKCSMCDKQNCIVCGSLHKLSLCDICNKYHCEGHDGLDCSDLENYNM